MRGKLEVLNGEGKGIYCFIKDGDEATIGRSLDCSVPVPDIKLSRIHCIVNNDEGEFQVLDNNSTNGTFVNGDQVEVTTSLNEGDIIIVGHTEIKFSFDN